MATSTGFGPAAGLRPKRIATFEVIWLLRGLQPDFKTVADFRRDNRAALKAVFRGCGTRSSASSGWPALNAEAGRRGWCAAQPPTPRPPRRQTRPSGSHADAARPVRHPMPLAGLTVATILVQLEGRWASAVSKEACSYPAQRSNANYSSLRHADPRASRIGSLAMATLCPSRDQPRPAPSEERLLLHFLRLRKPSQPRR